MDEITKLSPFKHLNLFKQANLHLILFKQTELI